MSCKSFTKEIGFCPVKDCNLSHPPKCRNDNACFKNDCTFYHSVSKCQTFPCLNKKICILRHVKKNSSSTSTPTSSTSTSTSTPIPTPTPTSTSTLTSTPTSTQTRPTFFPSHNQNNNDIFQNLENEYKSSIDLYNQQLKLENEKLLIKESEIKEHQLNISNSFEVLKTLKCGIDIFKSQIKVSNDTVESISNSFKEAKSTPIMKDSIREIKNIVSKIYRETWRLKHSLPALSKRKEIEDYIRSMKTLKNNFIIIKGYTGSGKSTQVCQYIADMNEFKGKTIICTQPRKLAVLSLRDRVSMEFNAENPNTVPNEQVSILTNSSNTKDQISSRILFCTESTLISKIGDIIQEMNRNPNTNNNNNNNNWLNNNVGAIIIDEAHERSINTDLLIGLLKMNKNLWSNLPVIVTSASLDTQLFLNYLNNCPLVEIPGKMFPVQVYYNTMVSDQSIVNCVVSKALELFKFKGGDILCFLTGQEEVEKAKLKFDQLYHSSKALEKDQNNCQEPISLCLYGKQLPDDQKKVFETTPKNKRKVIFSTDVAETSITIDGLEFVIDSGFAKSNIYDPQKNTMSLKVHTISKSSADQRRGRAGRTGPGVCYRLYSSNEYDEMQEGVRAEIFCRPLSTLVATLVSMSINPLSFNFIESPSRKSIEMAICHLKLFDAIQRNVDINENTPPSIISSYLTLHIGQMVVKHQVDPGIMNMIYQSCELGFGEAATRIAGIMNVGSMILWRGNDEKSKAEASTKHSNLLSETTNLLDPSVYYKIFSDWVSIKSKEKDHESISCPKWSADNFLNNKALGIVRSNSNELISALEDYQFWKFRDQTNEPSSNDIRKLCLYSQFNNIAVQIKPGVYKTIPIGNSESSIAMLHPSSIIKRGKDSDADSLPETIFYQSILNSSKPYLSMVTSIPDLNWINQATVNGEEISYNVEKVRRESKVEQITIENVSRFILIEILGKQGSNTDIVIGKLGCESLSCRVKDESFSCLYNPYKVNSNIIRERMQDMIEQVRYKLSIEAKEEQYLGQSRVVFGSGLKVVDFLTNSNQFISIYISNLPNELINTQSISNFIIKMIKDKLDYGNIKDHELIRQVYVHPSSNEKKGWAKVMLNNSNLAKQIQKIINGEVCNGEILKCTGSGISLPSTLSSIFGTLVITLINLDGGKGKLEFERALSPSELAQVQLLPIFKDFQSNGKFTLSSISYDEDNIREYIFNEKLPQPKKIILYRRPISQEFGYNDVLDMDKIIPQSSDIDSGIPFKDLRSNTYGIKYYFNDATLLESIFQNLMRLKDPKYKINVYYNSNVSIHFQINKLNCDSIDTLSKEFKSLHYGNRFKSVTNSATTSNGNNSFEYKLSSKNINQLKNTINSFHLLCNPSDIFTHSNKELVFSTYGRKCMAKLSIQTYLYWNNKTHTIMIYSNSKQEIEDAKNQLNSLVTELENLQIDTKFTLTLKGRLELVEQDKKDSNFIIKLVDGLKDSRISGRTLFVTGTKESIDKLEMIIKDKLVPRNRNNLGTKECSICFSEDEELFTFQKCGHQFCRSCINSDMLVSNNSIQKCASIGCDAEISLCDILNICSNGEDLDIIKRRSILEYQRKNSSNVYCCPNPLCLQLLKLPTKDILLNSGDINNSFVFCDQCKLEYCIFCSKKQGKATLSHRGLACSVSASAYTNLLDLLNTKCPNCQMVFFEFDGCYAVVCTGQGQGGCQAHFCGFCLHISSDSISNHNHVQNCAQNPGVGYYADKKVFYDIRNNEKKKKIIESIKKEQDMEKRLVLFNSIKSHCEFNIYEYEIK